MTSTAVNDAIAVLNRAVTDTDKIAALLLLPRVLSSAALDGSELQAVADAVDPQLLARLAHSDEEQQAWAAEAVLSVLLAHDNQLRVAQRFRSCANPAAVQRCAERIRSEEDGDAQALLQCDSFRVCVALVGFVPWATGGRPLLEALLQSAHTQVQLLAYDVGCALLRARSLYLEHTQEMIQLILGSFSDASRWDTHAAKESQVREHLVKAEQFLDEMGAQQCWIAAASSNSAALGRVYAALHTLLRDKTSVELKRECVRVCWSLVAASKKTNKASLWQRDAGAVVLCTNCVCVELRLIADQQPELLAADSGSAEARLFAKGCLLLSHVIRVSNDERHCDWLPDAAALAVSQRVHDTTAFFVEYLALCQQRAHSISGSVARSLAVLLDSFIEQGGAMTLPLGRLPLAIQMLTQTAASDEGGDADALLSLLHSVDAELLPVAALCSLAGRLLQADVLADCMLQVTTLIQALPDCTDQSLADVSWRLVEADMGVTAIHTLCTAAVCTHVTPSVSRDKAETVAVILVCMCPFPGSSIETVSTSRVARDVWLCAVQDLLDRVDVSATALQQQLATLNDDSSEMYMPAAIRAAYRQLCALRSVIEPDKS